ncbi:MAG: baseplate J/gp47 family protein [Synergistaceae bacterium]|jgi:uncharacterized phage protein gp47/JayE|nr:baseplate J/gp47 family protein [Synergistaceae bacterium]
MAIKPHIDETGIHIPEYHEIAEYLKERWRSIFGEDLYLENDSQEGEMLEIFALALYDSYQFTASAYQSFSPQTAQGAGLSRMVRVNGIRRRPATHSYADVRVVGVAGTRISGGIAEDVAGQKWILPANVDIPFEGEALTTVTAQDAGAIRAQPGEINKIATPMRGWQSVGNPDAAIIGHAAESDAELRFRQAYSTELPSLSIFEGIIGAVADLDGVTAVRGYENFTDETDGDGLPPHSVCLVVDGGEAGEIAAAIHRKKTPGTGTHGDIEILVKDRYWISTGIKFSRPAMARISVGLTIRRAAGYSPETADRIKGSLAAYVNSLGIGNSVLLSKLYAPVDLADAGGFGSDTPAVSRSPSSFEVTELLLSRDGGAKTAQNVLIGFNEMASLSLEDIDLTVV